MRTRHLLPGAAAALLALALGSRQGVSASDQAPDPGSSDFYAQRVRAIFGKNCLGCHDASAKGGLRLDSYAAIRKGGADGAVLTPGDPDKSMLIQAVRRSGDLKMPPRGALAPAEVADLEAWVKAGAAGDDGMTVSSAPPASRSDAAGPTPATALDADLFENKVRPILANSCYGCHAEQASGGFRLDSRAAFEKGGAHGAEVVPGDPENSRLILAVRQTGALKMPKGGKLKPEEVSALADWVKAGAKWPESASTPITSTTAATGTITAKQRDFWSFQPLRNPTPPPLEESSLARWARTPIDHFILAGLHQAGLTPAPEADRRTLIRRATYDLTGLPPTQAEVEAFERDKSSNAWEKVVDRLLASPRYGERWGRHWLDVARYAEDDVRGLDPKRRGYMPFTGAYRYRDWVIKAFNDDLPYDRFLVMQLAGDRLPAKSDAERDDNRVATTYLGAGPWVWDQAEPVQGRADERNERVDAVTRGMLGLTVACARCHNHKYDPIAQQDYYRIVSIFASSTYKEYPVVSSAEAAAYDRKVHEVATLRADLDDQTDELTKQLAGAYALRTSDYLQAAWKVLGKPKQTIEEVSAADKLDPEVLGRWIEYLPEDHAFPFLNDWKAMMASPDSSEEQAKALADAFEKTLLRVRAEGLRIEHENQVVKDKNDVPRFLLIDTNPGKFDTFNDFCPGCELELKALPSQEAKFYQDIFVTQTGDQEEKFKPGVLTFYGWGLTRRLSQPFQDSIAAQEKQIGALDKEIKSTTYPYLNGMEDKPKAVDVSLNIRGNPHALGPVVPRGFLTVLSPADAKPYADGSGRLEFAEDIARHPLAARVIVNRIWKWHFGSGIVNTPDNFGTMGDKPSNPDLLEYLAAEFAAHGHSIKWLQRAILLSAVYRTSNQESAAAHDKDGGNRLYSHFTRQRLDAEELRDSILFVAGDLDLKNTSGPSADMSPDNLRRTVFCKVSRYRLNNYLAIFDFPNPSFTAEQRFSSNVPLQQLYFMNNSFVYGQAGVLSRRVADEPSEEARIAKAYEYLFARKPTAEELALGEKFVETTPEKPGYTVTGEPITAWHEYARALLSSNEFQFVN